MLKDREQCARRGGERESGHDEWTQIVRGEFFRKCARRTFKSARSDMISRKFFQKTSSLSILVRASTAGCDHARMTHFNANRLE